MHEGCAHQGNNADRIRYCPPSGSRRALGLGGIELPENERTGQLPFVADVEFQHGDIIFAVDNRNRIIYWNADAEKVFGWSREHAVGAPWDSVVPLVRGSASLNVASIAAGREFAGGVDSRTRAGTPLALYVYAAPGKTRSGGPAAVFVARDVSDFRRAEESAKLSEEKYRVLFDHTTDSVAIADINGRVLESNAGLTRVFGYSAEEARGMNLIDPVAAEQRVDAAAAMANLASGRPVAGTFRMVRKDGSRFFADVVASVVSEGSERRILSVVRDVTARIQADEATRASELKYRTIFNTVGDGVLLLARDGRVNDANENAAAMLGYPVERLRTMRIQDLVLPETRAMLTRVNDVILRRGLFRGEAEVQRSDKTLVPVELVATLTELTEGAGILLLIRDITERKTAEQSLRDEKERAQQYLDVAGAMFVVLDREGNISLVNRRCCEVLGRTEEQLLGRNWFELCLPEGARAEARVVFERLVSDAEQPVEYYENPVLTVDGRERVIAWHNVALRDKAGRIMGTLSSGEDVTELRLAAVELAESEERYRTVFETTGTATIIIEEDTTVSLVNREFERLSGYSPDEVRGKSWTGFVHKDDLERMKEYHRLRRVDPTTVPRNYEFRFVGKKGELRYCFMTADLIPGTKRSVASVIDITGRKLTEQALAESEASFRALAANANEGIGINDEQGRFVYVNRRAAETLGYTEDQMLAMNFRDTLKPEALAEVEQRFRQRLAGGEPTARYVVDALRADGATVPVELSVARTTWHGRPAAIVVTRDLTESRRNETRLAASEQKFRTLAERSPNMVFINSFKRVVYANEQCAAVMGYTREEMTAPGFDFMSLIAPESRDLISQAFVRHQRGEDIEPYEYALVTKDGRRIESIIATRLMEYEGSPAILGIVTDITARKLAEKRMLESEERYRKLVELSPDVIAVHQEGRIVMINRAGASMLGYESPDELLGKTVLDFVPLEDRPGIVQRLTQVLQQGRPAELMEERFLRRDGSVVPVEVLAVPFRWNGQPAVQVMVRDISARKQAEKRMQESEEQYRRLVELSPDGIAVHQDGRIVLVNPAGARSLGYAEPSELIGRPALDIVHPEDRMRALERISRTLKEGQPGELNEERFIRKDGSVVPVEVVNAPFYWRGRPAVLVVARDVSERRQAEKQLVESEERYRQLVEASPDGIAVYQDGLIMMANRVCAVMFGYEDPLELLGRPAASVVLPDDLPLVGERETALREGSVVGQPLRVRYLRKDGGILTVSVVGALTTWRGRPAVQVMIRPDKPGAD